jgi:hypothetical protein
MSEFPIDSKFGRAGFDNDPRSYQYIGPGGIDFVNPADDPRKK